MAKSKTMKKFKKRKVIWHKYYSLLKNWTIKNDVKLPFVPLHCDSSYHMFYIIMPNEKSRNKLIAWLNKNKINQSFITPLHTSRVSKKFGWDNFQCPRTNEISKE